MGKAFKFGEFFGITAMQLAFLLFLRVYACYDMHQTLLLHL